MLLRLRLTFKWFDLIENGEKTNEYRKCSDYWNEKFENNKYDEVLFYRGYTKKTMKFEIKSIKKYKGKNDLNEEIVWKIKLGGRIDE